MMFEIVLLGLLAPLAWSASFCDPSGDWQANWADEFDGTALNSSSWSVITGSDVGACRDALCTADNVQVSNGKLILTSKRESQGKDVPVFRQHVGLVPAPESCHAKRLPKTAKRPKLPQKLLTLSLGFF